MCVVHWCTCQGTRTWPNGDRYAGSFKHGMQDGEAVAVTSHDIESTSKSKVHCMVCVGDKESTKASRCFKICKSYLPSLEFFVFFWEMPRCREPLRVQRRAGCTTVNGCRTGWDLVDSRNCRGAAIEKSTCSEEWPGEGPRRPVAGCNWGWANHAAFSNGRNLVLLMTFVSVC